MHNPEVDTAAIHPPALIPPAKAAAPVKTTPIILCWVWRGSQSSYRSTYGLQFAKLFVREIVSVTQSESDGNISITLFYR